MSELFIPKKINVGYQKRNGTYTGRLAYVIYFDNKGVLRKEKSWQSWRDKKIAPDEFDNTPQDGFCLNKDVKRYNWSHFGSNRSYIRMYDPRGIEFEVTPENLIGILTETDCLKRGLEGKFVYAWQGTELVLLPCVSEEYTKAKEYTARQDQDISARDLKPGFSYTTKKGEEVIYIGRFPWFEWCYYDTKPRKSTKQHIFVAAENTSQGKGFFKKSDVKFLATANSTDAVLNYVELIEAWNKDVRSSSIEKWEFSPETLSEEDVFGTEADQKVHPNVRRNQFIERDGDAIVFWTLSACRPWSGTAESPLEYRFSQDERLNTSTMVYSRNDRHDHFGGYCGPSTLKQKIMERVSKAVKVKMVLANGKKIPVKTIYDVAR